MRNEAAHPSFCFLSGMLRRRLRTPAGGPLGILADLKAALSERYPEVQSIVVAAGRNRLEIPATSANVVSLAGGSGTMQDFEGMPLTLGASQFLVRETLLDRQVVDVHGAKVVRVNDVQLLCHGGRLHVVHVDIGLPGLARRLGFEKGVRSMASLMRRKPKDELVSWKYVQPLNETGSGPVRISLRQEQIRMLHPGELADIIEELDPEERLALVRSIDTAQVADAIEETDGSVQAAIIRDLDSELAADILEEMEPAAAVDVVEMLSEETQQSIMAAMEEDEREQIEILSRAEEDTAATVMTLDFLSIPEDSTAGGALALVREKADQVEFIHYLYCLDPSGRLSGVVSLRNLILAGADEPTSSLMHSRLTTVHPDDPLEDLADAFLKFRFQALPVVDEEGVLEGVVTFQHSFDELLPFYGKASG